MRSKILTLLAVAGAVVSAYLYLKTFDPSSVICSVGGGCETVLSSQYAKIFDFPVAGLGLVWYLALLALIWLVYFKRVWAELPVQIWGLCGLLFSLYLLYLEHFKIHAYCTWCLVSLGIVVLINGLIFIKKTK